MAGLLALRLSYEIAGTMCAIEGPMPL